MTWSTLDVASNDLTQFSRGGHIVMRFSRINSHNTHRDRSDRVSLQCWTFTETRDIGPMLGQCWDSVVDAAPTLTQLWANMLWWHAMLYIITNGFHRMFHIIPNGLWLGYHWWFSCNAGNTTDKIVCVLCLISSNNATWGKLRFHKYFKISSFEAGNCVCNFSLKWIKK